MRPPYNKSRPRGRNNRRPTGNTINRVFESSGPEGKVRGNAQQIIEKYQALSRDAFLAGDRVAAENYAQHSEHYIRMLGEAQREFEQRRETEGQRPDHGRAPRAPIVAHDGEQPYERAPPPSPEVKAERPHDLRSSEGFAPTSPSRGERPLPTGPESADAPRPVNPE